MPLPQMIRHGKEYTEAVTIFSYIFPSNLSHIGHTKYMVAKTFNTHEKMLLFWFPVPCRKELEELVRMRGRTATWLMKSYCRER